MRSVRFLFVALAVLGLACGNDEEPDEATGAPTTSEDRVPVCVRAQDTVGAADPPTDLVTLAAEAARIADIATAADEPLHSALEPVSDAAAVLTDAARAGDQRAIAEAATALTIAYDELDAVAASMEAAECTSESWGRQVAIAALDLLGGQAPAPASGG